MTVYSCPGCRTFLTFRPAERRTQQYVLPHSDDFAGCDVCGYCYCAACSRGANALCKRCGGSLHEGRSFAPTGLYRLPGSLVGLPTQAARLALLHEQHEQGLLGQGEYQSMLALVEAVGDARRDDPADG